MARPDRPSAVAPINARQFAAAAISASSVPLPPRPPEPEKRRVAVAGPVALSGAQNASAPHKNPRLARPDAALATRLITAAQKPRQVAAAAISAFNAPLPQRRPEAANTRIAAAAAISRPLSPPLPTRQPVPERTTVASAVQVALSAAQNASTRHLGERTKPDGSLETKPVTAAQKPKQRAAAGSSAFSAPPPPSRRAPENASGHTRRP